jgi:aminomethyltransferase
MAAAMSGGGDLAARPPALPARERRETRMPAPRHTPYYHKFVELGAELGDRMGFLAATRFTSVEEEHRATREGIGLYDVYYQGPIDVKGTDAHGLLNRLMVNDLNRIEDGGVIYTSICNEQGGMLDDLTVYRLSGDHFWLVCTPSRAAIIEQWVTDHAQGACSHVTNCVSGTAYLSIQGPNSRAMLQTLTDADLSNQALPYYRFIQTTVAEVPALLSRTGYSGELGYEVYYPRDYAEHMWDSLVAAGSDYGLKPAGLGALRTTRMEKKYPLYGLDISEDNTPLEANLGWTVRLNKGEFIGRDVLRRQKEEGVSRLLVGIELPNMDFLPARGDTISVDDRQVGSVTSAENGFWLGKNLAMGFVAVDVAKAGVQVTITSAVNGEDYAGVIHTRAFYDPNLERLRS